MANVEDVAKYFLCLDHGESDSDGITNMKLQKLTYYAQGFYLALYDEPLFSDDIGAWNHGPVVVNLYHAYKKYDRERIPFAGGGINLSKKEMKFLDEIYSVFGGFSASQLRRMTHNEPPWLRHEDEANVITQDEMKEYFKTRIRH